MIWNVYLEEAALFISTVLLLSYIGKKHLPFRSWNYFTWILATHICSCVFDIGASRMAVYPGEFPVWTHYLVNIAYYISYTMEIWSFAIYTIAMTGRSYRIRRLQWFLFSVPFVVVWTIVVLSPVNHMFFYIAEDGSYHRGWGYLYLWCSFLIFYVLTATGFAWFYKSRLAPRRMMNTVGFWTLSLTGIGLQGFLFPGVLLEGIFNTAAIIIIYIDIQNPSMYMDADTGLYNQWALGEVLEEMLEYHGSIGITVIGIEDFQVLENIYGRTQLMQVLHSIGEEISGQFRRVSIFYMHRGRFALLFKRVEDSRSTEDAIRRRFNKPWQADRGSILFRIHMMRLPAEIEKHSVREIFDILDYALKIAISVDRGETGTITESQMDEIRRHIEFEQAVGRAVREKTIDVYFQPIYSTEQQSIVSVEALARLNDDKLGEIEPEEFIPIAELSGSINDLGIQVFEKVCQFIHGNDMKDMGLAFVEVNLSPVQCRSAELPSTLMACMNRYEIDPAFVNFEITESAMGELEVLQSFMYKLIDKGSSFSLDDYGTGYSNLIKVFELPFKIVKIDREIVWSYFNGTTDVLPDVINTFHGRGYKVVAEGVETQDMVESLTGMKCDYLQGFYYSKPMSADQLISYVYNSRRRKVMEDMNI